MLHEAIHAGDADRRNQRADGRRNQADQQRDQHGNRDLGAGVVRERLERDDDQQEDERQHREQDVQRDLVRRLLTLRPFDERDHAIEKRLARVRRDAHDDPVRQHARAGRHGRAIAAGFANHRRGLAGDSRLVDAGHAFDDLAIAGDELAGLDAHDVAGAQRVRRHGLLQAVADANGVRLGLGLAQRGGLRLAAAFGHRLGEVGEDHREPEPERHLSREQRMAAAAHQLLDEDDRRQQAAGLDDEHHRVAELDPWIELLERIDDRRPDDGRVPDRDATRVFCHTMPSPTECSRKCSREPLPSCRATRRARDSAPAR